MIRLLIFFLTIVLIVLFALDNMQHATVGLIIGEQVHVRLFFLLLTSFLLGALSAVLLGFYNTTRAKSKSKVAVSKNTEDDEFFFE